MLDQCVGDIIGAAFRGSDGLRVPIIAEQGLTATPHSQARARRQFEHVLIDRARLRDVAQSEEFFDRARIDPSHELRVDQKRLELRTEDQCLIAKQRIVERFFAQTIAGEKERSRALLP